MERTASGERAGRELTQVEAERIAQDWIAAWNAHDLDAILAHYAVKIEFTSPFVERLMGAADGTVRGIDALRDYFHRALETYPELHFELRQVFAGHDSLVICYQSVNRLQAAEMMHVDSDVRIDRVWAHYAPPE